MKKTWTAWFVSLCGMLSVSAQDDIINFSNNDTLHGTFLGFKDTNTLEWQSLQSPDPTQFSTDEIRKIIFQRGEPRQPFTHHATIQLTNGDTLPCSIESMDNTEVTVHTDFAGTLQIPRNSIRSGTLSPLGHQLIFKGPYHASQWEVFNFTRNTEEQDNEEQPSAWEFGNFSWLNQGLTGGIKLNDVELPKSVSIQFNAESPLYTDLTLILYADSIQPEKKQEEKRHTTSYAHITKHFGTCLALKIHSTSASLSLNSFSEDGETVHTNVRPVSTRGGYRKTTNNADSTIEVRSNLDRQIIAVYRDGQLLSQWDLSTLDNIPNGTGVGFCNFSQGRNYLTRISDISIAPWSGVIDPAISLSSNETDVILLNNGLDRFSGEIKALSTSSLELTGEYGKMNIPTADVDSFHLKVNKDLTDSRKDKKAADFEFHSSGKITAKPIGLKQGAILVEHPILGELSIEYKYLSAINYADSKTILDRWNTQLR